MSCHCPADVLSQMCYKNGRETKAQHVLLRRVGETRRRVQGSHQYGFIECSSKQLAERNKALFGRGRESHPQGEGRGEKPVEETGRCGINGGLRGLAELELLAREGRERLVADAAASEGRVRCAMRH